MPTPEEKTRSLMFFPCSVSRWRMPVTLFFFHLGNAAMLPLLGQSAVARFRVDPAVYTAGTVFIAQTTMIATSLWGGLFCSGPGPLPRPCSLRRCRQAVSRPVGVCLPDCGKSALVTGLV